jgi:hypothetical protein
MYRSMAVKLVFLNSLLVLSGCEKGFSGCEEDKRKGGPPSGRSCRGSSGGAFVHGVSGGSRPASTGVGRGGFGRTGGVAVS